MQFASKVDIRRTDRLLFEFKVFPNFFWEDRFSPVTDNKAIVSIQENIFLVVVTGWLHGRTQPYIRISTAGLESKMCHAFAKMISKIATSSLSTIQGTVYQSFLPTLLWAQLGV
jgi:hypothetical protein